MATTYGSNRAARTYPATTERDVTSGRVRVPFLRRISWGAILAGVVVALVTQIALNALGLAIGAASIEPQFGATPTWGEFSSGVVIWLAASMLLSLFAGGYVAGRMAATVSHTEATIHGIATWALSALLALYFVTIGAGSIIGGVASVIGSGLNLAAQGTAGAVTAVTPAVANALEARDIEVQAVYDEVRQLLLAVDEDATVPNPADEVLPTDADGDVIGANMPGTPTISTLDYNAATTGTPIERRTQLALSQLFVLGVDAADDATRQDLIQLIANNTNLTEEEASARVAEWETRVATFTDRVETEVETAAGDFADAVASAAGVLFAAMVVGAAAAGAGAFVGAPDTKYIVNKMEDIAEDAEEASHDDK